MKRIEQTKEKFDSNKINIKEVPINELKKNAKFYQILRNAELAEESNQNIKLNVSPVIVVNPS